MKAFIYSFSNPKKSKKYGYKKEPLENIVVSTPKRWYSQVSRKWYPSNDFLILSLTSTFCKRNRSVMAAYDLRKTHQSTPCEAIDLPVTSRLRRASASTRWKHGKMGSKGIGVSMIGRCICYFTIDYWCLYLYG